MGAGLRLFCVLIHASPEGSEESALILAVESLRRQEIPATLRATPPDDSLGVAVVGEPLRIGMQHVLVNAFGFGGSNVSVVVSRPSAERS